MAARKPKSASKSKPKSKAKAKAEMRAKAVEAERITQHVNRRRYLGRGRPTKYNDNTVIAVRAMAEAGALRTEIARNLGISYQTLRDWEMNKPEFSEALNLPEKIATRNVERSLLQRATGYEYAAEKVFQYRGEIVRAPVIEHCPPDPQAAMKWLTNRAPDRWQERTVRDVNATVTIAGTFEEYLALVHGKAAPALEVVAEPVKDAD